MKLLWGDIHNHCGITYGFGSQTNALKRGAGQLDFCAITGHAMWPDMYEKNQDTAFIVDFHQQGFQKLTDHWEAVRAEVAKANGPDFVTFQAYEMHSSLYGDHHLVSPDDTLPLLYRDSPKALKKAVGVPALTVAHHIGYTPGYRGINWDLYDESVTPLVEVLSKHGCAMNETAPFPYYHDMGPRDSRNTVYEGLRRGYHFGFVGSTDHHAGYPGSYGDGKLAVLAEGKDRESIWQALLQRRTYAVTGDRIACELTLNDMPMGSILPMTQTRNIRWQVKGGYQLDRVVLYKNLKPVQIVDGLLLPTQGGKGRYQFRVEMGWGDNSEELFRWDGRVAVGGGRLVGAEPCFRGRSILSPTDKKAKGADEVNDIDNRLINVTDRDCTWQCFTLKNTSTLHSQTCAVIFEIEGSPETEVEIDVNGHKAVKTLRALMEYGYSEHMKPWHSQAFKVHPAIFETQYSAAGEFCDSSDERAFYHLEVSQRNHQFAYVTPIWVE